MELPHAAPDEHLRYIPPPPSGYETLLFPGFYNDEAAVRTLYEDGLAMCEQLELHWEDHQVCLRRIEQQKAKNLFAPDPDSPVPFVPPFQLLRDEATIRDALSDILEWSMRIDWEVFVLRLCLDEYERRRVRRGSA